MAVAYNAVPKADLKCHIWAHQTLANSTRKDHLITPAFPMDNLFMDLRRLVRTQPCPADKLFKYVCKQANILLFNEMTGRETACVSQPGK